MLANCSMSLNLWEEMGAPGENPQSLGGEQTNSTVLTPSLKWAELQMILVNLIWAKRQPLQRFLAALKVFL